MRQIFSLNALYKNVTIFLRKRTADLLRNVIVQGSYRLYLFACIEKLERLEAAP
jgi:hypothetical protein